MKKIMAMLCCGCFWSANASGVSGFPIDSELSDNSNKQFDMFNISDLRRDTGNGEGSNTEFSSEEVLDNVSEQSAITSEKVMRFRRDEFSDLIEGIRSLGCSADSYSSGVFLNHDAMENCRKIIANQSYVPIARVLHKTIDQKNQTINEQSTQIEVKDATIEQQIQTINTKDAEIASRQQTINNQTGIISQQNQTINEQNTQIEVKDATIEQQVQTINTKDTEIASHQQTINNQAGIISQQNQTINEQNTQIEVKDATIEQQNRTISQKDKELASQIDKVNFLEEEVSRTTKQLSIVKRENDKKERKLSRYESVLKDAQFETDLFINNYGDESLKERYFSAKDPFTRFVLAGTHLMKQWNDSVISANSTLQRQQTSVAVDLQRQQVAGRDNLGMAPRQLNVKSIFEVPTQTNEDPYLPLGDYKYIGGVNESTMANGKGCISDKAGVMKIEGTFVDGALDISEPVSVSGSKFNDFNFLFPFSLSDADRGLFDCGRIKGTAPISGVKVLVLKCNGADEGFLFSEEFVYVGGLNKRNKPHGDWGKKFYSDGLIREGKFERGIFRKGHEINVAEAEEFERSPKKMRIGSK